MRPVLHARAALRTAARPNRALRAALVLLALTDVWLVPAWSALIAPTTPDPSTAPAARGPEMHRTSTRSESIPRRAIDCRCAPETVRAGRCCCRRGPTATPSCCVVRHGAARDEEPAHGVSFVRLCGCGPESNVGLPGAAPRLATRPIDLLGALLSTGDVRVASDRASSVGDAPEPPPPKGA